MTVGFNEEYTDTILHAILEKYDRKNDKDEINTMKIFFSIIIGPPPGVIIWVLITLILAHLSTLRSHIRYLINQRTMVG